MEKKNKETLTTHFKMLTLVVKGGLSFRHDETLCAIYWYHQITRIARRKWKLFNYVNFFQRMIISFELSTSAFTCNYEKKYSL